MFQRTIFVCLVASLTLSAPTHAQDKSGKLEELIQKLKSGNDADRLAAAMALTDFGPAAEPAVPALVAALGARSEDLRLNASIALGKIGASAVEPVLKALASPNATAGDRYYAIWTLGWIGPPAKNAAPQVIAALKDADDGVRRKAAYTLGRIAPDAKTAVAPLIKTLADPTAEVRQAGADALGKFGAEAVPPLIDALKDDSPAIRTEAARALGNIGSDASAAVGELKGLFLSGDAKISNEAAEALAKIGKPAVSALGEALKNDSTGIRAKAVQMLGKIGADAVPVLLDALGDKNVDVRMSAASALAPLRVSDKMVVLALAHAVHDPDQRVRQNALNALQMLGIGAKLAAPKLVEALKNSDGAGRLQILNVLQGLGESEHILPVAAELLRDANVGVRLQAVGILGGQGAPALPHLVVALKDSDVQVRFAAASAIQRIPGDIKDAMPALVALLGQGNNFQRRQVVLALGRVGGPALPHIMPLLKDNDQVMRSAAIDALRLVGPDAKKAIPTLSEMVLQDSFVIARRNAISAIVAIDADAILDVFANVKKHNDEKVRLTAYQALYLKFSKKGGGTTLPAKQGVPIMIDATKDASANVRLIAVQALANYGASAKDAIPAVTALLNDADQRVRQQAQFALDQIKPKQP